MREIFKFDIYNKEEAEQFRKKLVEDINSGRVDAKTFVGLSLIFESKMDDVFKDYINSVDADEVVSESDKNPLNKLGLSKNPFDLFKRAGLFNGNDEDIDRFMDEVNYNCLSYMVDNGLFYNARQGSVLSSSLIEGIFNIFGKKLNYEFREYAADKVVMDHPEFHFMYLGQHGKTATTKGINYNGEAMLHSLDCVNYYDYSLRNVGIAAPEYNCSSKYKLCNQDGPTKSEINVSYKRDIQAQDGVVDWNNLVSKNLDKNVNYLTNPQIGDFLWRPPLTENSSVDHIVKITDITDNGIIYTAETGKLQGLRKGYLSFNNLRNQNYSVVNTESICDNTGNRLINLHYKANDEIFIKPDQVMESWKTTFDELNISDERRQEINNKLNIEYIIYNDRGDYGLNEKKIEMLQDYGIYLDESFNFPKTTYDKYYIVSPMVKSLSNN